MATLNQIYDTNMQIGDYVPCRYSTLTSNKIGILTELGTTTSTLIPSSSASISDGKFNWIYNGKDYLDRNIFIADRNIQHSISYDILNATNIANDGMIYYNSLTYTGYIYLDATLGDDTTGNGTSTKPYKTLNTALTNAKYSNAIILKDGIYPINTTNKYLTDLCTTKNLTFIGNGANTIIEVGACNSSTPTGFAFLKNLLIRPSNTLTGDTRALFYANSTTYKMQFDKVVFTKSLNGNYPSSWYFIWSASGSTLNKNIFNDCSFATVSAISVNGTTTYNNCLFANASVSGIGTTTNCTYGVTFNSNYNLTFDTWVEEPLKHKLYFKLLTTNDWDNIIVNSNLNNTITIGDNNIWNWSGISSWTSSIGDNSSNRIVRGNTSVSATNAPTGITTSTINSTIGFRPLLIIETVLAKKYLIKQNSNYYTIKSTNYDSTTTHNFTPLTLTGGSVPNKVDIDGFAFDDLSVLTNSMTVNTDTFVPINKFDNTAELKMYKG